MNMSMNMKKMTKPETAEKSWNPLAAYNEVNRTINNEWPDWKKQAYNEMFAVSTHAKKISTGN